MKRTVLLFAVIVFLFSACTGTVRKQAPLDKVQGHYSLTAAKTDGCVVFEDLHITSGKPVWDTFFNAANLGKTASVRLAYYYTLGDPSHYTPELYAEIKDDYPKLFLRDLNYIDGKYTVTDYEEGRFITKEYRYLVKFTGKPKNADATFSEYTRFALVNDNTVTWDELEMAMVSSRSFDGIDFCEVYTNLIKK